jgi:hypothetical protein
MSAEDDLIQQVRALIEAENEGGETGRDKAGRTLAGSEEFTGITRASGTEENREGLLETIDQRRRPGLRRELIPAECWISLTADLGIVRSLVRTIDASNPSIIFGTFRNTHVFRKEANGWLCIAWQVTRLE